MKIVLTNELIKLFMLLSAIFRCFANYRCTFRPRLPLPVPTPHSPFQILLTFQIILEYFLLSHDWLETHSLRSTIGHRFGQCPAFLIEPLAENECIYKCILWGKWNLMIRCGTEYLLRTSTKCTHIRYFLDRKDESSHLPPLSRETIKRNIRLHCTSQSKYVGPYIYLVIYDGICLLFASLFSWLLVSCHEISFLSPGKM